MSKLLDLNFILGWESYFFFGWSFDYIKIVEYIKPDTDSYAENFYKTIRRKESIL